MKQYHKSYYEESYQEKSQKGTEYYKNQLKELTDWREESIAKKVKQYEEQIPKIQELKMHYKSYIMLKEIQIAMIIM